MAAVPRRGFAPACLWHWDGHAYRPVDREAEPDRWATEVYGGPDDPAVTQVADGLPTSSLSAQAVHRRVPAPVRPAHLPQFHREPRPALVPRLCARLLLPAACHGRPLCSPTSAPTSLADVRAGVLDVPSSKLRSARPREP
ncbi:hypothetical protein [Actinacidiphila acididurans]|uniref:Uncharacterized protein n=1 Tax=Actinacidiphila acididurans TaxID=2784346 RepID=A0ABS2TZ59_9ACTN|nr:hypothetical protein [Actinacidiphila acididurans]MBM9508623.1 hypothetical protein [Actinacidiphila acididurans]